MEHVLDLSTKKIARETPQDFDQQQPIIAFNKDKEPSPRATREDDSKTPNSKMLKTRMYSTESEDSPSIDRFNRPASQDNHANVSPTAPVPYYPPCSQFMPANYLKFQQQLMSQWLLASQLAHRMPQPYFPQNFLQNANWPISADQKTTQQYPSSMLSTSNAGTVHSLPPTPQRPAGLPPAKNIFDYSKSPMSEPDLETFQAKHRKRSTTEGPCRGSKSKKSKCKERQVVTSQSTNGISPFTSISNRNLSLANILNSMPDSNLSTTEVRRTPATSDVANMASITNKYIRPQTFEHSNDSQSSGSEKSSFEISKILACFGESNPKENGSRSLQQSPTSSSSNNNHNDAIQASADCSDNETDSMQTDLTEYREKRRKNNAAAKRSRDQRRIQEEAIAVRVRQLCDENVQLKAELTALKSRSSELEKFLELKKQMSARTSR